MVGDSVEDVLERAAGSALAASTTDLAGERPEAILDDGYAGVIHVVVGAVLEAAVPGIAETVPPISTRIRRREGPL
jgi:hypothetical protein